MSEPLFVFDRRNYRLCQQLYRGERNQEYYLGQYAIEPGSIVDVRADRRAVGSSSVIRLRSRNRLSFRRSWSHIQADATDVSVLWLVKRGSLNIVHPAGQTLAAAGDFTMTCSTMPFLVECCMDDQLVHEVLHVVVPTDVLRRFPHLQVPTGFSIPMQSREFAVAERILTDVLDDTGGMSEQSSRLLIESALSLLHDALAGQNLPRPSVKPVAEQRLEELMRFIEIHFCDPTLTLATAAHSCGISTRYLAYLLERQGLSFSQLIWQRRLQAAREWLLSPAAAEVPISKIAYRVGFKSAAHFSRKFKQAFAMSPLDYRARLTNSPTLGPVLGPTSGPMSG